MKFRLICQFLGQAVVLLGRPVALILLGTQRGVDFAQLLLQGGVGFCKDKKEEISTIKKEEK